MHGQGQRWQRGPWYLTFPLIGLVGLSFLSALMGVDPALTLYHAVRMLLLLGVYFALVNTPMPPLWVAAGRRAERLGHGPHARVSGRQAALGDGGVFGLNRLLNRVRHVWGTPFQLARTTAALIGGR